MKCPACGSTHIQVEVKTWCEYEDGKPVAFDYEDVPYVEIAGGVRICIECEHTWSEDNEVLEYEVKGDD